MPRKLTAVFNFLMLDATNICWYARPQMLVATHQTAISMPLFLRPHKMTTSAPCQYLMPTQTNSCVPTFLLPLRNECFCTHRIQPTDGTAICSSIIICSGRPPPLFSACSPCWPLTNWPNGHRSILQPRSSLALPLSPCS
ncbi:unnamed protein product, partial [Laminaria digitata]